jgi:hypothetical protein
MTAMESDMKTGISGDIMPTSMVIVTIASIVMQGMAPVIITNTMIVITVSITLQGTIAITDIATMVTDITRHPR